MDVGEWLRSLGLGQYEALFRENDIDAEVLGDLTDADLEKFDVSFGHRKRLLKAIATLASTETAAKPVAPVALQTSTDAAERRQLTVMFCDLVGSTAMSARLDPEDMRQVIRAYQDACSGVVARYDGFVAKFMGDGILAYFGFPHAHEDDAARAVHAGLEIAEVVAGLQTRAREKLAARVGIATGLVVVGDLVGRGSAQEQAVVGDTPNLAARLQGLAEPGSVVLAASTRRLLSDVFRLRDLGRHAVKGLAESVQAWAALGVSASESRFEAAHATRLTGFVGRESESAALLERQRRAWAGQGQVALISGEAGIGKSRLSAWLAEQVADTPHTRLRYQCSPYHRDSALYPFVQQFERAAGIAPQEPPEVKLEKLEKVLGLATDRTNEIAPLIAAMLSIPPGSRYPPLGLSPAQQRRQTLSALLDQMEGLARKQPVLIVFEDAHWADATSLEVLDLVVERVRRLPVLFLVTFRPEFEAPWKGLPDVATIGLQRLDRGQAEMLVERVTGGRRLPAEVLAQIVAKTDGVPLFVEELTKNVLESGLLIEDGERFRLDGPLPPLAIPSTLQDSLMARLDRLSTVKEIAQIGAAIGREFSYALLHAVVDRDEATLQAALAQLEDSELVFRSGEPPIARYTFKHALVQDTAYESLLKSRRQILHRRIAETLRDKFPAVVEAGPELLAHHFTQAGLTKPAIEYWGKAGDLALRRSAFKEAIAHLGKAIEMTEAGDAARPREAAATATASQRLKLQTNYGQALIWSKGYAAEETKTALARVGELARESGNAEAPLDAYFGRWAHNLWRGEFGSARETAESFLREAERAARPTEAAAGHCLLGATVFFQGDFAQARAHSEHALRIYDPERDSEAKFRLGPDSRVLANAFLALAAWCLGDVGRARELIDEAVARAVESAYAPTQANTYFCQATLEILSDDAEAARRAAESSVAISREHGLALWLTVAAIPSAWARAKLGDRDAGSAEFRQALANYATGGNKLALPFFRGLLAEIETEGRGAEAALAGIDEALALAGETGEHWFDAALHRIRGEILLKQNPSNSAPAEEAFLAAIATAQAQKARSFELRAALSLAKLYQSTDRPIDAHDVLGPALEGFSPTPEFPAIAEAQALFDALPETEEVKAAATSRKRRIELQLSYGNALFAARGFGAVETKAAFERARELASGSTEGVEKLSIHFGLYIGSLARGEFAAMSEHASIMLNDCGIGPDAPEAGIAHRAYGVAHWYAGHFATARVHFERALAIFDPERDSGLALRFAHDTGVSARAMLSLALWPVGEFDRARRLDEEMLARASQIEHVATSAFAHMQSAVFAMVRHRAREAAPHATAFVRLAREHEMALWTAFGNFMEAWTLWQAGEIDEGLRRMRGAMERFKEQNIGNFVPLLGTMLAEAEARSGEIDVALVHVDEAVAASERTGQRWFLAEIYRARGEMLVRKDASDPAAERAYLTAIAIAQDQKARSFELRAALSLAKFYRACRRDADAHAALGPALEGFAPTSEFPEIEQARALLADVEAGALGAKRASV